MTQEVKSVFCMKFYLPHNFPISTGTDVKADIQFLIDSASIINMNE